MEKKYREDAFLIAGTSAVGPAACSTNMIYQGFRFRKPLLKGEIKITGGLGLIDDVIIDTHFVQRGRIGRLFQAVVSNPRVLGIGSGRTRASSSAKAASWRAIGSGLVILVDGRKIKNTNLTDIALGEPISIEKPGGARALQV